MKATYLFTRKINKEEYKFFHADVTREESATGEAYGWFYVKAPKNDLGYDDLVMFSCNDGITENIYSINRPLAPWKKRKCAEIFRKNGYNPFSTAYIAF